jgi:acyl CoA:acetate/3-ketoacid CoA transferase beta subunit
VDRLEGSLDRETQVLRLLGRELGENNSQLVEMGSRDFLIQLLGKHVHAEIKVSRSSPEGNLGKDLVCETARHDKRGMSGGTSEVDESTFSEENDSFSALHGESIDLCLDV